MFEKLYNVLQEIVSSKIKALENPIMSWIKYCHSLPQ